MIETFFNKKEEENILKISKYLYSRIENMCVIFNLDIDKVLELLTKKKVTQYGTDIVLGLGKDLSEHARIYAYLTDRKALITDTIEDWKPTKFKGVVLTLSHRLSPNLFERLYEQGGDNAPGLIYANTKETLYDVLIIKALLSRFSLHLNSNKFVFHETKPSDKLEEVHKLMTQNNDVLSIHTHADGLDVFLGEKMLCCMENLPKQFDVNLSPSCFKNNYCHRVELPFEKALKSNRILFPSQIQAKLLFLHVCWGISLRPHAIESCWGFAQQLLNNNKIGAILTTWKVMALTGKDKSLEILNLLESGKNLGEAVAYYNQLDEIKEQNATICLLGDPKTFVNIKPQLRPSSKNRDVNMLYDKTFIVDISFLRNFVLKQIIDSKDDYQQSLLNDIFQFISLYELAFNTGSDPEGSANNFGYQIRHLFFEFLFTKTYLPRNSWYVFEDKSTIVDESESCFQCGEKTVSRISTLRISHAKQRYTTLCPCCGLIRDTPIHFKNLKFKHAEKKLHITGDWPSITPHTYAGIILFHPIKKFKRKYIWPTDEKTGIPIPTIPIPTSFKAKGHLYLSFFFMEGCNQSVHLNLLLNEL